MGCDSKYFDVACDQFFMMRLVFFLCLLALPISAMAKSLRVISLSPHTTELAYEAGLGENLIAVSAHSDYPVAAQKLEQVADYRAIKTERIIALKPDLVIAWKGGNPEKQLAILERFGIRVFYSNPHSLYDSADNIEALGQWSNAPEKAKQKADNLRSLLATLENKYKNKTRVSYFYQLSHAPLITNNQHHWPQPLFSLCAGDNIFASSPVPYPQISIEHIIKQKPEAFFYLKQQYPQKSDLLDSWKKWHSLIPALKNNAVFALSGDWLNRPTPRALQAIQQICDALDKIRQTKEQTTILASFAH